MAFLIKGQIAEGKMAVESIYNLDSQYNIGIDTSDGIIMAAEPEYRITTERGKEYRCVVNVATNVYEYTLVDRPLTQEEQMEILAEENIKLRIDLTRSNQQITALELALVELYEGGMTN